MDDRMANGVRRRMDGKGDEFANDHRSLPSACYMTDCDAYLGLMGFGKNSGDTLYMEFVPDDIRNRGKLVREYGLVAVFERKRVVFEAARDRNSVQTSFYLSMCRMYAEHQPVAPRFFFVYGTAAPFTLQEVNIYDGTWLPSVELPVKSSAWYSVWEHLGLMRINRELSQWLQKRDAGLPNKPR